MISIIAVEGGTTEVDAAEDGVACLADDGVIPICVRGGGIDCCCCVRDGATAVWVALAEEGVIPNCVAILLNLVCGGGGGGGGPAVGVALAVDGVIASFPVSVLIDELFGGAALLGDVLVKVKPVGGRFVML